MHKKKNQSKLNLPSVGIKPTQTSKNYGTKNNISKCREIDDRNIYFEMPSIHQNDLSLKTFMEAQQRSLHKIQVKILKYFENVRENKMFEEWDLYIKKSQIINTRNIQFSELQEFLVKTVYKVISKLTDITQTTSFSFNKSTNRTACHCQYQTKDQIENKTLQDRILLSQESKLNSNNKSIKVEEQIDPISVLNQQNVLLQKKTQIYEKRIEQLSIALSKYQQKQNDNSGGQKDTTNQLMQAIAARNKFKYQSQVKAMHIESLTRELNLTRQQLSIVKTKLEEVTCKVGVLVEQNAKIRDYLKYKQLWQMATEQVISWRQMAGQERQEKERGVSKIKLLKDKNKQLLNYFNMSNAVNPDQEEDKQDLDKIIKEFKEWLMIISVPKVANHSISQQNQPQQRLTNLQEVNVKLLRPNFYIFFQAFQNTLIMQKNIINIRPIQYNFFLKIRVIFDSMFKQFLISSSYKDYPSFPQYVIGFLQKYQVNTETGKLQYRKKPIENQEKITFLVNLFNKNFCNTWQCQIFKSFLFENYYLDEIYFFLQCRNQFNGGVPSTNVLGSVDPISYVKLSKALKVVAKQLAPYQNYIIEKVKNILKNKKKIKYGQSFVDKHFVLKLLLEVYSLQRAKSQRIFESSFKLKMKKSYITFGDFHHFMTKNFAFITSTQVAQLYREVYTLSSGHVTHRTIHYICGSKGLFIPLLLEKRVNKSGFQKSLSGDMLLLDIQNVVTKSTGQLQDFGQESFMSFQKSINNFMRQLEYYKSNKSLFYQKIYQQKCRVLRINTLIELGGSYELNLGETLEQSQIQTRMIQLHSLLHQTDTQVHLISRQKQKRNKAWRMLVRNFKIRIQESILQFEKVNQEEIKKLRQQMQRTNINKEQQLEQQLKKEKVSQNKINS